MDHEARWNARYRAAGDDYLFGIEPNRFLTRRAHLFQDGHTPFLWPTAKAAIRCGWPSKDST